MKDMIHFSAEVTYNVFMLSLRPLLKSNLFECEHSIFIILKLYILLFLKRKQKRNTKKKKKKKKN